MITKELRAERWGALLGLLVIGLRILNGVTGDAKAQTLASLNYTFDADFSAVSAHHISTATAFLWATYFNDLTQYLLVGLGGVVLGAGLIASETSSGSIYVLLSRPVSRTRALLTKYAVAAAVSFVLCAICGSIALIIGAINGFAQPPLGGFLISVVLMWLGMLFVISVTLLFSVLIPNALAAGVVGFFFVYFMVIIPVFHSGVAPNIHYFLGGPDWELSSYWGTLGIYMGVESPLKSLVIGLIAAIIPTTLALWIFVRKAF
jgi:ABC-type transport system involved in multi-copper enzyme maturation permease subunit